MLIKIKRSLEKPLVTGPREFVVPVDLTVGKNFCKEKGLELKGAKFSENETILATKLEEIWGKLDGAQTS
jgi:hypothetical protein